MGQVLDHLIFISIAAYNDPELFPTIHDAYEKASRPELLRFGIVDQCVDDRYSVLPEWRDQIRYLWIRARDARGVCFARSIIPGMMDSEAYVLQIDSHMRFDLGWDELLINQLVAIGSPRAILTASPMPWTPEKGNIPLAAGKTIILTEHPDYPLRNRAQIISNVEGVAISGDRLAAGFFFSYGRIYDEVPYDPHIYFNGEEYIYAQRLMRRGWKIYHPACLPIYHLYKMRASQEADQLHWTKQVDRYWSSADLSKKGDGRVKSAESLAIGDVYSVRPVSLRSLF
jgi:hypothetical protein